MDDKQLWQDSLIEAIFEADPSGLAVIAGPDLRVVYANPSFRMICSSSPGEILGSPFKSVWPADSSQLRRRLSQVIHSGKPCIMTGYEYQFPDGAVRYFTVQIRRVAWQDQPAGLLILWDITDQQKASLQAQQERDRLAAVLQSIPDEVWICDTTGKIVQANQAAKQNIGVDEKWPVNRNVRNLLTDLEVCNLDGTPLPPEEAPLLQ